MFSYNWCFLEHLSFLQKQQLVFLLDSCQPLAGLLLLSSWGCLVSFWATPGSLCSGPRQKSLAEWVWLIMVPGLNHQKGVGVRAGGWHVLQAWSLDACLSPGRSKGWEVKWQVCLEHADAQAGLLWFALSEYHLDTREPFQLASTKLPAQLYQFLVISISERKLDKILKGTTGHTVKK